MSHTLKILLPLTHFSKDTYSIVFSSDKTELQVILLSLQCLPLLSFLLSSPPSYFPPSLFPANPGLPTARVICSACR